MNLFDPQVVAAVGLLALITNALVEAWLSPFKQKYPTVDTWWALYVSWVLAGIVSGILQINLFALVFPQNNVVGVVLTALVAGRGANFLSELQTFLKKPTASSPAADPEAPFGPDGVQVNKQG